MLNLFLIITVIYVYKKYFYQKKTRPEESVFSAETEEEDLPDKMPYEIAGILLFIVNGAISWHYIGLIKEWDGFSWPYSYYLFFKIIALNIICSVTPPFLLRQSSILPKLSNIKNTYRFFLALLAGILVHWFFCALSFI